MHGTPNPKAFYDGVMTEKLGRDYESARWHSTPTKEVQYEMHASTIRRYALPALARATRVLELGPGPGTWTKLLLHANPRAAYTLVDISREMLAQAKAALPADAQLTYVESDFLAFTPEYLFDGFFSSRALEYIADKELAARKLASALARGARGVLITKTPKPLFDRLRDRVVPELHQGQVSPARLAATLRAAGLRVLLVRPATATVPLLNSARLNRFAFRLVQRLPLIFPVSLFTESYCVIFEKP